MTATQSLVRPEELLPRRAAMLVEERPHVRAELGADARGKREQQRPVREIRKLIAHGSAPRPRRQQALGARLGDERLETAGLGRRDALTQRGQPEVAPPFIDRTTRRRSRLFDEAIVERARQGPVEVTGENARAGRSVLKRADDGPAVSRAIGERKEDLENERLEGTIDAAAGRHVRDGTSQNESMSIS